MSKRKVLVPLDGSEFSRQIVDVVCTFFDPKDVRLILFRAAYPPSVSPEISPHDVFVGSVPMAGTYDTYSRALDHEFEEATKERETYRTELVGEMRADAERLTNLGYAVDVETHFGDPAERIIDYVNDEDVDLVAMSTHGRSGIGRLVLGSVAERVLRGVAVPVLLLRTMGNSGKRPTPGEELAHSLGSGEQLRVAVASDGSTLAQQGVTLAANVAKRINARLTVLATVSDREPSMHGQRLMEQLREMVGHLEPRPEIVPLVGYADEVLLQQLAKQPVDLLIMGAFQDRGAGSITAIGPMAQRMVQYAPTSVWMYKGHHPEIRRILACVAVDDTVVVDVTAQLARALGADLSVLHVVPPTAASYLSSRGADTAPAELSVDEALAQGTHLSEVLQGWIAQLEKLDVDREVLLLHRGTVPEAILRTAHSGSYDLVVVGSQSGPGHFLGSVANGIVRYAEQSVMVVRTHGA